MTTKIHPALCTPCSALILALLATLAPQASTFAQGTAFTYQGRLLDTGSPANGNYDMRFYLRDALILVRVQAETNNPRPCTDAPHSISVRSQPRQAHFQGSHYSGHV